MRCSLGCCLVLVLSGLLALPAADAPATIRVDAAKSAGQVSRYLTGACIEDVNHEIYGGLYSQMIFGESFQEPAFAPAARAASSPTAAPGQLEGETLLAEGGPGPKLVSDHAPFCQRRGRRRGLLPRPRRRQRRADRQGRQARPRRRQLRRLRGLARPRRPASSAWAGTATTGSRSRTLPARSPSAGGFASPCG